MPNERIAGFVALAVLAAAVATGGAGAARAQAVTDAFSGLSVDSDQPVKIEADQLEVFDKDKVAVFSGNVTVRQGKTTMQTSQLKVHYTGGGPAGADGAGEEAEPAEAEATAAAGGGGDQRVSRLEATGRVVVKSGDQTATGDWAIFEMASQEVTLGGAVVLSQGKNVLRGTQLIVNLETGQSKLVSAEQSGGGGRVQGLFIPGAMGQKQEKRQNQEETPDQSN